MNKKKYLWTVFLAVLFGLIIGNLMAVRNLAGKENPSLRFVLPSSSGESKINRMIRLVEKEYVDTLNATTLIDEMAANLAAALDPHSVYIPATDRQEVDDELEGSFSGIGIQFNIQQDTVMIVSVISGGPSEKVGLLAGDRIVTVNDSNFTGKKITNNRVMKNLRGRKGTKVTLSVRRNGTAEPLTYTVTRGDIPVNSVVAAYIIAPQIGFVRVDKFAQNTYKEFLNALATLKSQGARKFIIDLRENSGGFMEAAIAMINEFLPRGQLIVYAEGKSYPRYDALSDGSGTCTDNPVAVLIDDFSASASEIFAGAIQDNDRGIIIGRRSFGKGTVQQQFDLGDGSAFRMTVARYYTPSGRSVQKPYTLGETSDYNMDLVNRFAHGEFDSADSIHLKTDTLVYKTVGGRKVYGGGGIMPDIFVPRDTSGYSPYLNRALNMGYLYQFAFKYTDEHREQLSKFRQWKELQKYLENQPLIDGFIAFTAAKNLKATAKDIAVSKSLIINMLESYIIRNIIGDIGFYPVFYQQDKTVLRAIEELKNITHK